MKHFLRPFTALALALILTVTCQSMAVTRGASAATGQMVLCIGTTTMTVFVDADGQPTSAPHICPDCAFSGMLADVGARVQISAPMGYSSLAQIRFVAAFPWDRVALGYAPRAPPLTV